MFVIVHTLASVKELSYTKSNMTYLLYQAVVTKSLIFDFI